MQRRNQAFFLLSVANFALIQREMAQKKEVIQDFSCFYPSRMVKKGKKWRRKQLY